MGLQRGAVSTAAQRHGAAKHSEMRGVGALGGAKGMQVRRRGGRVVFKGRRPVIAAWCHAR